MVAMIMLATVLTLGSHLGLIFPSVALGLGTVSPGTQGSPHPHGTRVLEGFSGGETCHNGGLPCCGILKKELYRTSQLQCHFTMETLS